MAESPLSLNALEYTFRHLLKVAFPQMESEPFRVEKGEGMVTVFIKNIRIIFKTMAQEDMDYFLKVRSNPQLIANAAGTLKIPMFYFNFEDDTGYGLRIEDFGGNVDHTIICSETEGSVKICYDLLTPSFLLLSRYEEFYSERHDEHGRFPYGLSLAENNCMVEIPLVDEYAMLLRRWLCQHFPDRFQAVPRTPRVVPTHDIDILYRFKNRWPALKSIFGRDLLINRDLKMVLKSLKEYKAWKLDPSFDPYVEAVRQLSEREEELHLSPVFFVKATEANQADATYDVHDPILQHIIWNVTHRGGQIGLHGSYPSADDVACLHREKQNLSKLCDKEIRVSRQHYLRARFAGNPNSLDLWRQAGITDDYTLGFAERCGFRCGTCHPYPLYDVRNDRVTDIIEHPLIVMDGTLFDYMKLSVEEAKELVMKLKQRCFDVEGDFVILWHNHATTREFEPYFNSVYLPLLTNDYD